MGDTVRDVGGALVAAVADLKPGLEPLLWLVFYMLALLAFVQGCLRLSRKANGDAGAGSLWGAGVSFVIAAVLAWMPQVLSGAGESLFGKETAASVALGYGGREANYQPLLEAVVWIVRVIGLLSFAKGMYVLRGASDGVPGATVSGAAMHLVGGAMAWHILFLLRAIQETLGISVLRIT